jgi:hypothetical protein
MKAPLIYWASGGEVRMRGAAVSPADARAVLGVHLDEARSAIAARAPEAALRALRLAAELGQAITGAHEWRRAGSCGHGVPANRP